MDQRRSIAAVIIFIAGIVMAWFLLAQSLSSFRTDDLSPEYGTEETAPFILKHSAEGDLHVYEGALDLPTPCHSLSSSVTSSGGISREAHISLMVQKPADGEACAQVMDSQIFSVSLTSRKTPSVRLTIDGKDTKVSVEEK